MRKVTWLLTIGVCATCASGVTAFVRSDAWASTPWRQATTRKPQPLTELYFAKPDTLPRLLPLDRDTPLSFVIVNHEGQPMTYTYQLTIETNKAETLGALHATHIMPGERRVLELSIPPQAAGRRHKVAVRLLTKNQTIAFWTAS